MGDIVPLREVTNKSSKSLHKDEGFRVIQTKCPWRRGLKKGSKCLGVNIQGGCLPENCAPLYFGRLVAESFGLKKKWWQVWK